MDHGNDERIINQGLQRIQFCASEVQLENNDFLE